MNDRRYSRIIKYLGIGILITAIWFMGCSSNEPELCPTVKLFGNAYNQLNSSSRIENVLVRLSPGNSSEISDSDGYFEFRVESGMEYTLTFEKDGFQSKTQSISVDCIESDQRLDAVMEPIGPVVSVTPSLIDFGSSNTIQALEVRNEGQNTLTWQISENIEWLTVNPLSGTTGADVSVITLTADRTNLPNGDFSGTLAISTDGGSAIVTVSVSKSDQLLVSPLNVDFGTTNNQRDIFLENRGTTTINYSIIENLDWLTVSPTQGSLDTGLEPVSLQIDRSMLPMGQHSGSITITSNVNSAIVDVFVEIP